MLPSGDFERELHKSWFSNMPALELLYFVRFYHLNIFKSPQHKKGKQQGMVRQIKLDENMKISFQCSPPSQMIKANVSMICSN